MGTSGTGKCIFLYDQEIAKCSVIEGDLARLECFDGLSNSLGLNKPKIITPSIEGNGDWDISIKNNPVDDTKTVFLFLKSESGTSKWGKEPSLMIRCASNTTDLYINWHDYLGSDVYVLTRIGSEKAETKEWTLSTDKKSSFYPESPIRFIKKMINHNKLLAEVTPYNESPMTTIFKITGLVNAIKPIQETCNWK